MRCRPPRTPQRGRLACRADVKSRSLEQAVRVLNKVIGIASSPRNVAAAEKARKEPKSAKPKWVAFTASASAKAEAPGSGSPGRAVRDYLALPVSQYSLLDPEWVERIDEESFRLTVPIDTVTGVQVRPQVLVRVRADPASGSVTFSSETATLGDPALDRELALQLRATLGGVDAGDHSAFRRLARRKPPAWAPHPQPSPTSGPVESDAAPASGSEQQAAGSTAAVSTAATPDLAANGSGAAVQVVAEVDSGDGAVKAVSGRSGSSSSSSSSHELDAAAHGRENELHGRLLKREPAAAQSASSGSESGIATSELQPAGGLPVTARSAVAQNGGAAAADATPQELAARVDLRVSLNVPQALRVVPGPLLGYAGGLVLRVALQALLPSFLQLLAQDYKAWSTGDPKRGSGSSSLLSRTAGSSVSDVDMTPEAAPEDWVPCDKEGRPVESAADLRH